MTQDNIGKVITQARKKAQGYLDGYAQEVTTRFSAYLDNAQHEEGMIYLNNQLDQAQKRFSFILENFPSSLVSENIFKDHQFNDDFHQWYQAFKIIEADKSFSPAFTFDPRYDRDVFEQERQEYEENFDSAYEDNALFFSEVLIIVISYYVFRQKQITHLTQKIQEANSGRPGPGLNCPFTEEEKAKLYEGCLREELIAADTAKENFIKALSPAEYPSEKIRWVDINKKGQPKSISLACFYYAVVPASKDESGNYTIDRPAIKRCFADKDGNDFEVKTPKKTDPSFDRWMRKFRAMLNE